MYISASLLTPLASMYIPGHFSRNDFSSDVLPILLIPSTTTSGSLFSTALSRASSSFSLSNSSRRLVFGLGSNSIVPPRN